MWISSASVCVCVILYMNMYGYVLCLVGAGVGEGDTYQRVDVYDGSKAVGTVDYLVFKAVYLPLSIQCDHHTTPQGLCTHVSIYVYRTYFYRSTLYTCISIGTHSSPCKYSNTIFHMPIYTIVMPFQQISSIWKAPNKHVYCTWKTHIWWGQRSYISDPWTALFRAYYLSSAGNMHSLSSAPPVYIHRAHQNTSGSTVSELLRHVYIHLSM